MKSIKQKSIFWGSKPKPLNKPKMNWFKDSDRDGVINIFDCKPYNRKKQGWAHHGIQESRERSTHIRMMTPEKFLRTTYKESVNRELKNRESREGGRAQMRFAYLRNEKTYSDSVIDKNRVDKLKKIIKTQTGPEDNTYPRKGKMDVPFLEYDEQGRPTGHEGRHRATAAKELGVKLIPVTIGKKLKYARDWKNIRQTYPKYAKPTKHDWRNDLENVEEVISSKSADIPIEEQKQYGVEQPEVLQSFDDKIESAKPESFEKDTDGDGVVDAADCEPTNPDAQGIYHIHKMSAQKRKALLNNRKYLYHKTEHANLPSIIKKGTLQIGDKPFSLSELSNPHIVFKEYKQPVVIVLKKKHLSNLRKIDYKNPSAAVSKGTLQVLFESEKEWLAEGKINKAIKGVIFNEKISKVRNKPAIKGIPTRFVTDKDITRTRFKLQ